MIERKDINFFIIIIWVGLALSLAGVGLIAVKLNQTVQEDAERAFHKNLRFVSESAAKSFTLFMEGVINDIVLLTQLEAVKNYNSPKVDAAFRSVIHQRQERISHLILLDGAGEVKVMVTKDPDPYKMQPLMLNFFRETMASWRVNLTRRMFESETYRGIAIGMPIFRKAPQSPQQEFLPSAIYASGMVMALMSANDLVANLVRPVRIGESGFAWLYTGGGEILGDPERLSKFTGALYGDQANRGKRLAGEFGAVAKGAPVAGWNVATGASSLAVSLGGPEWLVSMSKTKILDQEWVMAVAAPQSEVTHLLTTSFKQSVMLVLFVVVILLVAAALFTRVNRRLVRAEEKARYAGKLEMKNRELGELNRRMDEFVSVVSHDIRSPLNVIRGFLRVIQSSPDGARYERETTNMLRSCNRLTQLTNDILDIAKLEAGKMELAYDPIVLDSVIMESVQTMDFATHEKNLKTVVNLGAETMMEGDSGKLLQVMNNLIGNAVKFTPKGGTITISKHAANGEVTVEVSDTGPGIEVKDLGIVFSKFEQVRRHQQGIEPGSGLGLMICKNIVELHGGAIGVTSSVGKGSTFHVRLPLRPPSGASEGRLAGGGDNGARKRGRQ